VAATGCGATAWLGTSGIDALTAAPALGQAVIVAVIALAGFLLPQLGSLLALVLLGVGAILFGAPVLGILIIVLTLAWWIPVGRTAAPASTVMSLTAGAGVAWLPLAIPFLSAYFLPLVRALVTSAAAGLLLLLIAPLCGTPQLWAADIVMHPPGTAAWEFFAGEVLDRPATWLLVLGFPAATLVMRPFAHRGTRAACILGAVLATVVLVVALVAVPLLLGMSPTALGLTRLVAQIALSYILVGIIIFAGVTTFTGTEAEEG
jgi:hypothetical protein